ncbi:hypothetical protein [Dickeya dianthicola]|uniref:hypothetical protein n=1 Tax=Dickeya dianthicola TaxID=204039 RepID=UPI00186845A9|nr:hypothetical protein [Dickeya dianthicola]QOL14213.1 hypothetical protein HGI48_08295 [Dickeya dianthicola]
MADAPDRHNGVTGSPRRCQPHAVPHDGRLRLTTPGNGKNHHAAQRRSQATGMSVTLSSTLQQSITSFGDDALPHNPVQHIMANHSAPPNDGVSCQEQATAKKGLAPPRSQ